MGKIVRNGVFFGSSAPSNEIVELTQAEYDALPDSKLTDGKIYMITDANPDGSSNLNILDTMEEVENNTEEGNITGALATKELSAELTNIAKKVYVCEDTTTAIETFVTSVVDTYYTDYIGFVSFYVKGSGYHYAIQINILNSNLAFAGIVIDWSHNITYSIRRTAGADAVLKKLGESETQFYSYGGTNTSVNNTFTATGSGKAHIFITARCDTGSYTVKVNDETLYNESGISSFTREYSIDVEEGDVVYAAYTRNTTSHWGGLSMVVP